MTIVFEASRKRTLVNADRGPHCSRNRVVFTGQSNSREAETKHGTMDVNELDWSFYSIFVHQQ